MCNLKKLFCFYKGREIVGDIVKNIGDASFTPLLTFGKMSVNASTLEWQLIVLCRNLFSIAPLSLLGAFGHLCLSGHRQPPVILICLIELCAMLHSFSISMI